MNKGALKIQRRINAPVDQVFNAWTEEAVMSKWMGPGSVVCEEIVLDFRVGGKYELHMKTDVGIKTAYGEYKEIQPNRKIIFTWAWRDGDFDDSLVTLTFVEESAGTLFSLMHENLPSGESASHHKLGWEGSIEKLCVFLS